MTPEERAKDLLNSVDMGCGCCQINSAEDNIAIAAAAIRAAVAEERERCASIAENIPSDTGTGQANLIADAIRG